MTSRTRRDFSTKSAHCEQYRSHDALSYEPGSRQVLAQLGSTEPHEYIFLGLAPSSGVA